MNSRDVCVGGIALHAIPLAVVQIREPPRLREPAVTVGCIKESQQRNALGVGDAPPRRPPQCEEEGEAATHRSFRRHFTVRHDALAMRTWERWAWTRCCSF